MSHLLQRNWRSLVLFIPFFWLLLFFLAPFFIVLKISLAEAVIASPPFTPMIEWDEEVYLSWEPSSSVVLTK